MLPLHHHGTERKCAGVGWRGKKNGDTEVSPFPSCGLSGTSRSRFVIEKSTELNKAGRWHRRIKNDDTEVSSFLTTQISGFNQRASSLKRVPKSSTSETLENYGVDEGSRTPGLQDHNLAL
jgi:hypothetical protein